MNDAIQWNPKQGGYKDYGTKENVESRLLSRKDGNAKKLVW